jgi:hypothetical protein
MSKSKEESDCGVQISIAQKAISQLELIERIDSLRKSLRLFIKVMIERASLESTDAQQDIISLSRTEIQKALKSIGAGSSVSMITRHLRYLEETGVADVERSRSDKGNIKAHYKINDFFKLINLTIPPKEKEDSPEVVTNRWSDKRVRQEKLLLRARDDHHLLESPEHLKILIHEKIFNGVLDSAVRMSYRDSRTQLIETTYVYQGSPLFIKTTCRSEKDSEIMASPDQRAMRAINSLARRRMIRMIKQIKGHHGSDVVDKWDDRAIIQAIPNLFTIDVIEMCRLMRMPENYDGIQAVVAMLKRLNDTTFTVDCRSNPNFKEMFSVTGTGDEIEFKYMHELEITREPKEVRSLKGGTKIELVPRFYSFRLETRVFLSLVFSALGQFSTLFISHPELAYERSGMVQRFYNWARMFVGSSDKVNLSNFEYDIHDMHERLAPATRLDNFKRHYIEMIERFLTTEPLSESNRSATALIYGYYLHVTNTGSKAGILTRIERNRKDPIAGDDGPHKRRLRAQAQSALDDMSEMDLLEEEGFFSDQHDDKQLSLDVETFGNDH